MRLGEQCRRPVALGKHTVSTHCESHGVALGENWDITAMLHVEIIQSGFLQTGFLRFQRSSKVPRPCTTPPNVRTFLPCSTTCWQSFKNVSKRHHSVLHSQLGVANCRALNRFTAPRYCRQFIIQPLFRKHESEASRSLTCNL
jgi:hypothetical protein